MNDIWQEIYQLLTAGQDVVVATIVRHSGSTPRTSGSKMVVCRDGRIIGTIGGGPVEADVIETAQTVFAKNEPLLKTYNFNSSSSAAAMDLICGGRFEILIEYFKTDQVTIQMVKTLTDAVAEGQQAERLSELIRTSGTDRVTIDHAVLDAGTTWLGSLQPSAGLQDRIGEERLRSKATTLFEYGNKQYLLEVTVPLETAYVLGAGHVAKEIVPLLHRASLQTIVIDDRQEFANTTRFPEADRVMLSTGYSQVFADCQPDASSYIIIVTRGHSYDKECLGQALRTKASYVGMIGSRKKREQIYRSLLKEGIPADALERVHCPIGLAIGGETPFEIAVSIVAEIIQHRTQKRV